MPEQPPEDPRQRQNKLLDKLGNALLGLKAVIELARAENAEAHKQQLAQGNAHLTQMALVNKALEDLEKLDQIPALISAIAEARKDIDRVDRSVDDVKRDLTPVHGTPLPTREEIDIELGPAKMPVKIAERIGRALPWIVLGFVAGLAGVIIALWLSGARLIVTEPAPAPAPKPAPSSPALPVPQLEKPRAP